MGLSNYFDITVGAVKQDRGFMVRVEADAIDFFRVDTTPIVLRSVEI